MLPENEYQTMVEGLLSRLAETIEDADAARALSVEYMSGILEITLKDDRQYVINMHKPTQQIWMASPVSGASYFVYDPAVKAWRSKKGPLLLDMLEQELAAVAGMKVKLA